MRKYTIKQNITDGKQEEVLQAEEILEDKIIDKKIIAKIRERYGENEEINMLRLGILDGLNKDFQAYNEYVEECQTWGNEKKIKAGQEKEKWKSNFRLRGETEKEYIARIKPIVELRETVDK